MKLKPCPFCNTEAPEDLIDNLYPSGIVYREDPEIGIIYDSFKNRQEGDKFMHQYICPGCGVVMSGHSEEEVLYMWNRRPQ